MKYAVLETNQPTVMNRIIWAKYIINSGSQSHRHIHPLSHRYIRISITEITTSSDTYNQILIFQFDQDHHILSLYPSQSQNLKTQVTYQYISH